MIEDEITIKLENDLCVLIKEKGIIQFGKTKYRFNSKYNGIYKQTYTTLCDFAKKYIFTKWDSIKVIYQCSNSNDEYIFLGNNCATSISVGDYSGGFMELDGLTYDCKYNPMLFNFKKFKLNKITEGCRFFILFYLI